VAARNLRNGSFINAPDLRFTLLARYTHPLSAASEIYGQTQLPLQDDVQFAYDQNPASCSGVRHHRPHRSA